MKILLILFFTTVSMVSDSPMLTKDGTKKLNQTLAAIFKDHKIQLTKLDLAAESITPKLSDLKRK